MADKVIQLYDKDNNRLFPEKVALFAEGEEARTGELLQYVKFSTYYDVLIQDSNYGELTGNASDLRRYGLQTTVIPGHENAATITVPNDENWTVLVEGVVPILEAMNDNDPHYSTIMISYTPDFSSYSNIGSGATQTFYSALSSMYNRNCPGIGQIQLSGVQTIPAGTTANFVLRYLTSYHWYYNEFYLKVTLLSKEKI